MSNISLHTHFAKSKRNCSSQNPQCEGDHQGRYLFNAKVPHCPRISYIGSVKSNIFYLSAGSAHGITVDSEMLIWRDLESYYLREDEGPIAKVKVLIVNLYNSTATAPPGSPSRIFLCSSASPSRKNTRTQDSCSRRFRRRSFHGDGP